MHVEFDNVGCQNDGSVMMSLFRPRNLKACARLTNSPPNSPVFS